MSVITLIIKSNIENAVGEFADYKFKVSLNTSIKTIKELLSEVLSVAKPVSKVQRCFQIVPIS